MVDIEVILITVGVIVGLKIVTSDGFILEFLRRFLETLPMFIAKPLGLCAICMNSIYYSFIFVLKHYNTFCVDSLSTYLFMYLAGMLCSVTLTYLVYSLVNYLTSKITIEL